MADDGRTHLQDILGARASEFSEASIRELTGFIDGGRPNAHLLAVTQARRRYETPTAQRSAQGEPIAESQEHRVTVADAGAYGCASSARIWGAAGNRLHPWRRLAARQHRLPSGRVPGACQRLRLRGLQRWLSTGAGVALPERGRGLLCGARVSLQARADALSIDPGRIAVAGDSAGGNLATVIAMLSRDRGGPRLGMQLLVYPVTTTDLSLGFDANYEGFLLYRDEMQWHPGQLPRGAGAQDRSARLAA